MKLHRRAHQPLCAQGAHRDGGKEARLPVGARRRVGQRRDPEVQPAGQGAVPGDGRRRGGVRFARHRRVPRHAVAGGPPDPGQRPRARRGAHLGGAGRRRARRRHPGAPGADLGRPQRAASAAQAWIDRQMAQGRRRDHRDVARAWATSRLRPASTCRWPTSRSAARSATSISAFRRSTGARRTRTWRAWPTSWRSARASSIRCRRRLDGAGPSAQGCRPEARPQAASSDNAPLRTSQPSLR